MRKNRNSFFTESNYSNFQSGGMPQNIPYQASTNYNSFYQSPTGMPYVDNTDSFESRLAKIERQINRLNARVNKLESLNTTFIDDTFDTTNNMYML